MPIGWSDELMVFGLIYLGENVAEMSIPLYTLY